MKIRDVGLLSVKKKNERGFLYAPEKIKEEMPYDEITLLRRGGVENTPDQDGRYR
ncbi:MAG: hypothetical protein J6X66_07930 [Lachnospiraceae bacterium]|nr:hypothetical protein [Lachnospiraceae bacterium]